MGTHIPWILQDMKRNNHAVFKLRLGTGQRNAVLVMFQGGRASLKDSSLEIPGPRTSRGCGSGGTVENLWIPNVFWYGVLKYIHKNRLRLHIGDLQKKSYLKVTDLPRCRPLISATL